MSKRWRTRWVSAVLWPFLTMTLASPSPSRAVTMTPPPVPDAAPKAEKAGRATNAGSAMEACAFRIEENGGDDFHFRIAAANRAVSADAFTQAPRAAQQQA